MYRLGHVNFKFWKMNYCIFYFLNFQNLKFQFKFQILRIWNLNSNFQTCHSFLNENFQLTNAAQVRTIEKRAPWRMGSNRCDKRKCQRLNKRSNLRAKEEDTTLLLRFFDASVNFRHFHSRVSGRSGAGHRLEKEDTPGGSSSIDN